MSYNKLEWSQYLDDTFTTQLSADEISTNIPRQVHNAHYSHVAPSPTKKPQLIIANTTFAEQLGLSKHYLAGEEFLNIITGNEVLAGTKSYAMCYGGHQFGNWAGQLGDGRAINLFEVFKDDKRWQVQLKGAGRTPYSRSADGLAVLRSSIREYLMSEAMYHLGVPTTRALSLSLSGDDVLRDMMYDGNAAYEPGAIVCRVAESFIRFGSFQLFASRGDMVNLRKLLDYTITQFYPQLGPPSKETYIKFFNVVTERTRAMIIEWQRVGFVHGVMNTDNLSILGLTIDYGPYGWMDNYDPDWTPNTTDNATKRYRFGQQPYIAQWNLAQLANAIYPLIEESEPLISILNEYKVGYQKQYLKMMTQKLGIQHPEPTDIDLIQQLDELMVSAETDMTLCYRLLSLIKKDEPDNALSFNLISEAFYEPASLSEDLKQQWHEWISSYQNRLQKEAQTDVDRSAAMNQVNPKYVLRNYMAQMAIDKAEKGDYQLIHELDTLLKHPYDEQPEYQHWFAKRPDWAKNKVGCSALSCSS